MTETRGSEAPVMGALPHGGETPRMELRQLTYAPLPLETHPIDLAYGSQGWGPFDGPWSPLDFLSASAFIDPTWMSGDNSSVVDHSPPYQIVSLFDDRSINYVANSSALSAFQRQDANVVPSGQSSTITQGVNSIKSRLISVLTGG